MTQRTYTCQEIAIPHADMAALRKAGDLNLGIPDAMALHISKTPELKPTKVTLTTGIAWRNWIAVAAFVYTLYLSITVDWWYFIFGLVLMFMLGKNTKKLNIEKILAAAEIEPAFYETQRTAGAWVYRIDEAKAAPYLKS